MKAVIGILAAVVVTGAAAGYIAGGSGPPTSTTLISAPATTVPGTCREGPLPDAACTPGVTNPAVTPDTLSTTICKVGWTSTIRPPVSVTGPEKIASMVAYGAGTDTSLYEYDHLISLELGGAPNDTANLWPEPHSAQVNGQEYGSFVKDGVENALKRAICDGRLALAQAQEIIAHNWTRGLQYVPGDTLPALPDP